MRCSRRPRRSWSGPSRRSVCFVTPVDHLLGSHLGIGTFARYCDDLLVFDHDPGRLRTVWDAVARRCEALRLRGWTVWSTTLGATVIAPILDVLARRKVTVFAHRAPTLLLRFDGSLLLRREESRSDASLFQLPPRITRFEASLATPSGPCGRRTRAA